MEIHWQYKNTIARCFQTDKLSKKFFINIHRRLRESGSLTGRNEGVGRRRITRNVNVEKAVEWTRTAVSAPHKRQSGGFFMNSTCILFIMSVFKNWYKVIKRVSFEFCRWFLYRSNMENFVMKIVFTGETTFTNEELMTMHRELPCRSRKGFPI